MIGDHDAVDDRTSESLLPSRKPLLLTEKAFPKRRPSARTSLPVHVALSSPQEVDDQGEEDRVDDSRGGKEQGISDDDKGAETSRLLQVVLASIRVNDDDKEEEEANQLYELDEMEYEVDELIRSDELQEEVDELMRSDELGEEKDCNEDMDHSTSTETTLSTNVDAFLQSIKDEANAEADKVPPYWRLITVIGACSSTYPQGGDWCKLSALVEEQVCLYEAQSQDWAMDCNMLVEDGKTSYAIDWIVPPHTEEEMEEINFVKNWQAKLEQRSLGNDDGNEEEEAFFLSSSEEDGRNSDDKNKLSSHKDQSPALGQPLQRIQTHGRPWEWTPPSSSPTSLHSSFDSVQGSTFDSSQGQRSCNTTPQSSPVGDVFQPKPCSAFHADTFFF
jgi:hypothetical protein